MHKSEKFVFLIAASQDIVDIALEIVNNLLRET